MFIFISNFSKRLCALSLSVFFCATVFAQPTMSDTDAKPSTAPAAVVAPPDLGNKTPKPASASASSSDTSEEDLQRVIVDFKLLKILGYLSVGVAVTVGLVLYAIRHRRIQKYDTLFALLAATLLAPLLMYAASKTLSTDASACLGVALGGGADASVFSDVCRSARESVANLFGFKSLWTLIAGSTVDSGIALALPAGLVAALTYLSATVTAPLLVLLLKPLVKATLSRN